MTYKTLFNLVTMLTSSPYTLLLALCSSNMVFLWFLEYVRHASDLGSLNWLLPLCECSSFSYPQVSFPHLLQVFAQMFYLLREAYPDRST